MQPLSLISMVVVGLVMEKVRRMFTPALRDMKRLESLSMILFLLFRRILRVSVWNHIMNVGNHNLGDVDIVLSQIDLTIDKPVIIRTPLLIDEFSF